MLKIWLKSVLELLKNKKLKKILIGKNIENQKNNIAKKLPLSNIFCQNLAINLTNTCHILCQAYVNSIPFS